MKIKYFLLAFCTSTVAIAGDIDFDKIDQTKWCVYEGKVYGPRSIIKMNDTVGWCIPLDNPINIESKIYQWAEKPQIKR